MAALLRALKGERPHSVFGHLLEDRTDAIALRIFIDKPDASDIQIEARLLALEEEQPQNFTPRYKGDLRKLTASELLAVANGSINPRPASYIPPIKGTHRGGDNK